MSKHDIHEDRDSNPDPITKAPGSHPGGTGAGALAGGTAGAAAGTAIGGPVGGVVGAAIGATAGGLAGKGIAEAIDPTVEDAYWREEYRNRPYVERDTPYEEYSPAYRTGYTGYGTYAREGSFEDAEGRLQRDYEAGRGESHLDWGKARPAARDAWDRVHQRSEQERKP